MALGGYYALSLGGKFALALVGQAIGLDGRCAPSVGQYPLAFGRQVAGLSGHSHALDWAIRLFLRPRSGYNHAPSVGL